MNEITDWEYWRDMCIATEKERDILRAELNHAVYLQDKIRAERDKAETELEAARGALGAIVDFEPEDGNVTLQAIRHIAKLVAIANAALRNEVAEE